MRDILWIPRAKFIWFIRRGKMPQVKILEEKILHAGDVYRKEEIREVSQEVLEYFCGEGWAEDVTGTVATAPRSTESKTIDPETLKQVQS